MSEEQYEFDLHWHALNYRTAASQHAHTYWFDLESCVKRIVDKAVKDSSAPDLLEALQEAKLSIESGLESDGDDLEAGWSKEDKKLLVKINAILAKAKGEA